MAEKRPLALYVDCIKELQAGDSIAGVAPVGTLKIINTLQDLIDVLEDTTATTKLAAVSFPITVSQNVSIACVGRTLILSDLSFYFTGGYSISILGDETEPYLYVFGRLGFCGISGVKSVTFSTGGSMLVTYTKILYLNNCNLTVSGDSGKIRYEKKDTFLTASETNCLQEFWFTSIPFDATPTAGSSNPVTSGGIYASLAAKAAAADLASHTGNTSNPHGVTAAQVGAAAASHAHSADDVTSGTLAVARGGTGQISVDTTPTSGSSKMVTSGGVYTALAGKQATATSLTATLLTTGWSSDSITVTATGVTASKIVIVAPLPASQDAYVAAGIKCTAQGTNTLTFTRTAANTASISVGVVIL